MMVKVFQTNAHGKIEFSRNELENLLNEVYNDGYAAGEKHMRENYWTWSPSLISNTTLPITYCNTTNSTKIIDDLCAEKTNTKSINCKIGEGITDTVGSILSTAFNEDGTMHITKKTSNNIYDSLAKELNNL